MIVMMECATATGCSVLAFRARFACTGPRDNYQMDWAASVVAELRYLLPLRVLEDLRLPVLSL